MIRLLVWLLVLVPIVSGCHPREQLLDAVELTIADLTSALAAGQVSCVEVIEAHLARIATYDKTSGVNAITIVNPGALDRARAIDEKNAMGESLGELF